jgi:hypothetical protein
MRVLCEAIQASAAASVSKLLTVVGLVPGIETTFGAQEYELLAERIEGLWFRAELAPALAFGPGKS